MNNKDDNFHRSEVLKSEVKTNDNNACRVSELNLIDRTLICKSK